MTSLLVNAQKPAYTEGHNFGGIQSLYYASQFAENVHGVVVSEYSMLIRDLRARVFSACDVGNEAQIAKSTGVPVLMIFLRKDPFFDVHGAYDILTRLRSQNKELIQVDSGDHYSIIESSRDIVGKWIMARLPGSIWHISDISYLCLLARRNDAT